MLLGLSDGVLGQEISAWQGAEHAGEKLILFSQLAHFLFNLSLSRVVLGPSFYYLTDKFIHLSSVALKISIEIIDDLFQFIVFAVNRHRKALLDQIARHSQRRDSLIAEQFGGAFKRLSLFFCAG